MTNFKLTLVVLLAGLLAAPLASAQGEASAEGEAKAETKAEEAPASAEEAPPVPAAEVPAEEAPPVPAAVEKSEEAAPAEQPAATDQDREALNAEILSDGEDAVWSPRRSQGVPAKGLCIDPGSLYETPFLGLDQHKSQNEGGKYTGMGFQMHGYMRVPMLMGIGDGKDIDGENIVDDDSGDKRFHAPPQIPDIDYLDWRFTNNNVGHWAELNLSMGNNYINGTIGYVTYNITDGSYNYLKAQHGIDKAYVTLSFPELFGDRGGLVTNVGVFVSQYGANAQYDPGKYDTLLFGATHVTGIQSRAYYDLFGKWTLHVDGGFGGKVDQEPFKTNPNMLDAAYLPYGGDVEIASTFLGHGHLGMSYDDKLFIGAHYMHAFARDNETLYPAHSPDWSPPALREIDANLIVWGFDIKGYDFAGGDFYLGYAHHTAEQVLHLSGALESVHSWNGYDYGTNYFQSADPHNAPSGQNGTINTIMGEYTLSLAKLLWYPREYWGQSADLKVSLFGMFSAVDYDRPLTYDDGGASTEKHSQNKLKWGADALFTPLSWLGIVGRFDMVQPNMDNSEESFQVVSGGITLRSDFIANEEIRISYSHYFYGNDVTPGYPYNEELVDDPESATPDVIENTRPIPSLDKGVIQIQASMWF